MEIKRLETLQKIEIQIDGILKDARHYSAEAKPATKEGGGGRMLIFPPSPLPPSGFAT